jgi:hypothetical protein
MRLRFFFGGLLGGVALVLLGSAAASAQTLNVKVGLWEVTTMGQMSGAPPIDTSQMTPERRAQAEAMMKSMMGNATKPHTRKTCITQEKLEKDPFEQREEEQKCKRSYLTRTSTVLAFKEECTSPDGNTTAEGRFEATSPETMKGTMKMLIDRAGKKMTMNNEISGKFVSASCGNVK